MPQILPRALARAALFALTSLPLASATYYVAPQGSDSAAGSFAAPWRTLQKAASTATAGDVVNIRAGTYRETVTFASSGTTAAPITFQNYAGESVTITGLDVVTPGVGGAGAWTQHSGNIWRIQLASTHGFGAGSTGRNQISLNGTPLVEARWPNSALYADVDRTHMAAADAGSVDATSRDAQGLYTCTYTDAALASFATNAWTGATLRMAVGKGWVPASGSVTASTASTVTFKYRYVGGGNDTPSRDDPYFLFGRLVALDTEGEFFLDDSGRDGAAFTLYAWRPGGGSPASSTLEVRTREVGLDFSGRSDLRVSGVRLLSARIVTSSTTANCTLDRLAVDSAGHNLGLLPSGNGDSVLLVGTNNHLQNSTITGATEFGVTMNNTTSGASVENCVIRDCGWAGINTADARSPVVSSNTVFDTGSFCILFNSKSGRITRNHAFYAGRYCDDVGIINTFAIGDAEGTDVSYNWAHDNLAPFDLGGHGWNGGCGIRVDCGFSPIGSLNVVLHHNVVWNTTHPGSIVLWGIVDSQWTNTPRTYAMGSSTIDTRLYAYNNTLATNLEYGAGRTGGVPIYASGGKIRNNLLAGTFNPSGVNTTGIEADTNIVSTAVSGFASNTVATTAFVSPLTGSFAIPSAAIDAGTIIAPYTDGSVGARPDIGAYESGATFWIPGATVLAEQISALTATYDGTTGRVTLSGFPAGRTAPAGAKIRIGTATSTAVRPALDLATRTLSTSFSIDLTGNGGVQAIALAPDGTTFTALAATITLPGAQTGGTTPNTPAISTAGRLINLSIRTNAGTGDNTLIVGVALGGNGTSGTKAVLLRGVGPSLAPFGVTGALGDPVMTVFQGSAQVTQNDDWAGGFDFASVGAFAFSSATPRDAAIYSAAIPAGTYSIQITGKNNATGNALAEIYDATPAASFTSATPRLVNVSARTQVGTGENILIAGFVVAGSTPVRVLVRAVGPTLGGFGVGSTLADPKLEIFSGATKSAENDNWGGTAELKAAFTSVAAFPFSADNSRDAALVATLQPGSYTAQISGVGNSTGVALVEVYELP